MTQPHSLRLSVHHAGIMRRAAAVAYPGECCGLMVGEGDAEVTVTEVVPAANTAEDPRRRFEINPQAQFELLRAARGTGKRLIGHYHSHPDGPAEPSAHDLAMAHDPEAVWVVIAADRQGARALRAFVRPLPSAGFVEIAVTETP